MLKCILLSCGAQVFKRRWKGRLNVLRVVVVVVVSNRSSTTTTLKTLSRPFQRRLKT